MDRKTYRDNKVSEADSQNNQRKIQGGPGRNIHSIIELEEFKKKRQELMDKTTTERQKEDSTHRVKPRPINMGHFRPTKPTTPLRDPYYDSRHHRAANVIHNQQKSPPLISKPRTSHERDGQLQVGLEGQKRLRNDQSRDRFSPNHFVHQNESIDRSDWDYRNRRNRYNYSGPGSPGNDYETAQANDGGINHIARNGYEQTGERRSPDQKYRDLNPYI